MIAERCSGGVVGRDAMAASGAIPASITASGASSAPTSTFGRCRVGRAFRAAYARTGHRHGAGGDRGHLRGPRAPRGRRHGGSGQAHHPRRQSCARRVLPATTPCGTGAKRITAIHKANVLHLTDGLFLESRAGGGCRISGTRVFDDRMVDAACYLLVKCPEQFDVLVLPNQYGDIISDLAAGLAGSLGLAPGANIGRGYGRVRSGARSRAGHCGQGHRQPDRPDPLGGHAAGLWAKREAAEHVRAAIAAVLREGAQTHAGPGRERNHAHSDGRHLHGHGVRGPLRPPARPWPSEEAGIRRGPPMKRSLALIHASPAAIAPVVDYYTRHGARTGADQPARRRHPAPVRAPAGWTVPSPGSMR